MRLDYENKIEFNFILRVTVSHCEPENPLILRVELHFPQ